MTFSTQFRVKLDTVSVEKGYSSDMIYPEWSSYSLIYFLLSIVSTHRCWNNILYKSLLSLTAHRYFKIRDGLHLHCACFYYQHVVVIFRPPLSLTLTLPLSVTSVILAEDILVTGTSQEGIRVWHPTTLTLLASGRLDNEMKVS